MTGTLFREYVDKWFKALAKNWVDTMNGERTTLTYFYKTMLRTEYSPISKWAAISAKLTRVTADMVALGSQLPVKTRDAIERYSGDLPKMGMKLFKNEKDISDINVMKAQGRPDSEIVDKLFNDTPKAVTGIWEAIEDAFLRMISTGVALLNSDDRPGLGIRVNIGIPDDNFLKAGITWDKATATPLTDVTNVIDFAETKGDKFVAAMLSKKTLGQMAKSNEGKLLYARYIGSPVTDPTKMALPGRSQFKTAFEDEFGIKLIEVNRTIRYEKDGKQVAVKPFDEDNMVFLTTEQVGTLYYGTLAEETNPVAGVAYTKVDNFILLSKYSKNDPLEEATTSQAIVFPGIDNVDQIYILDTMETTK